MKPRPTANFTANKDAFCQAPATVNFTNSSVSGVSYSWDFGDGTTSTQLSPSHTFTALGTYNVTLVVTGSNGCSATITKQIKVLEPIISFVGLPKEGCIPLGINFQAAISSTEPVTSYLWDFGNGATSTAATPSYTYTTQGVFTVSLTITTAGGCSKTYTLPAAVKAGTKPTVNFDADTGTFTVILVVKNNGCKDTLKIANFIKVKPPIAKFIFKNNCNDKLNITFTDQSIGAVSYFWDFGDGTTSTVKNPAHRYSAYGTYDVQLTVSNDTCQHTMKQTVKIVNGTPDFIAIPELWLRGRKWRRHSNNNNLPQGRTVFSELKSNRRNRLR
ncbi:MAG: PKD domain-containing protein [Chitinophagaceae bacterium]|nr:MAG: PKD domain-containing protein [Chitinophagaceae bacterium]